jgi:hypothetical protein
MTTIFQVNYDQLISNEKVIDMPKQWRKGDLLTTPEVAEILDVTAAWVSELCRQGRVPGAVQRGRFWFVPFESVNNIEDVKMGRPPKTDDKSA